MRRKKTEPQPPATPPLGIKKVRRTEEFIESVKDESAQAQTITIPAHDIEEIEPPVDRFEEFFTRVRDQQGWTLLIYKLNSFAKDGKTDMRGNNTYMGRIVFDPDTYLDDIQAMCPEGGTFKLQAKDPESRFSEQWIEQIAPVKTNKQAAALSNTHYFIQQPQVNGEPQPQRDTLQELLDAGKKAKQLKEVFGWDHEPPQVPVTPVTATVEREPLQDRIIGAALEAVLKTEKPETAADILRAYIAPPANDPSWGEIIKEVVKPMIPMFMGLVSAYMQSQAAKAQAQQANVVQNTQPQQALAPVTPQPAIPHSVMFEPDPQPVAMPTMPTAGVMFNPMPMAQPEPEQESEEDMAESAENTLLDDLVFMLQECVNRAASDPAIIDAGRNEIAAFRKRFPNATVIIDMLASAPPIAVIGMLSFNYPQVAPLINNKVAIKVIEDLQAALRPSEQVQ